MIQEVTVTSERSKVPDVPGYRGNSKCFLFSVYENIFSCFQENQSGHGFQSLRTKKPENKIPRGICQGGSRSFPLSGSISVYQDFLIFPLFFFFIFLFIYRIYYKRLGIIRAEREQVSMFITYFLFSPTREFKSKSTLLDKVHSPSSIITGVQQNECS